MVQLAEPVVAAADQRLDLARVRIEHHHGHLRLRGAALLFVQRVAGLELAVHVFQADRHGLRRRADEIAIQRGVNAETLREQFFLGEAVQQVVLHHVHKIRLVAIVDAAGHHAQRGLARGLQLFWRDEAVVGHLLQDAVTGLGGALRPALGGRIAVGGADDARQERSLRNGQVANVLIEVGQRAFGKSVNGEAAAIAQIDFVGVQLENLLLS